MSALPERALTILIAALGGEGGGVLSNWLVTAASSSGLPVQGTSIPGVAQRTGATTYYLEIYPAPIAELGGRQPVMALTPSPANVDVMVTSELLEAGRAVQNGFVTPDRTTLVGSTHRVYSVAEKSAMADGRYDGERILRAARGMAKRAILLDMAAVAAEAGSVVNAVLFGAVAGAEVLPMEREAFEAAIREVGIDVRGNLAGFAAGHALAKDAAEPRTLAGEAARPEAPAPLAGELAARAQDYPPEVGAVVELAVARLVDYQDQAYAHLFLEHLDSVLALDRTLGDGEGDLRLSVECGRYLALWMSYEDVIRVADLKTRASRFERLRAEVGAAPDEPVRVTEFLKPGLDELCSVLPRWLARLVRWLARRLGAEDGLNLGLHVRTTSVSGFLALWLTAKLKRWRRRTSRYAEEQALIARWLDAVDRAARLDYDFGLEVTECARLVKGYGETHRRGVDNFLTIMEVVIAPALAAGSAAGAARAVARARQAALADPEGKSLEAALTEIAAETAAEAEMVPAAAAGE